MSSTLLMTLSTLEKINGLDWLKLFVFLAVLSWSFLSSNPSL
jgi:hypothetical protein